MRLQETRKNQTMQLQSASTTDKSICARRLLSCSEQLFASLLALRVIVALSVVMVWKDVMAGAPSKRLHGYMKNVAIYSSKENPNGQNFRLNQNGPT